jgi:hypothetical protein
MKHYHDNDVAAGTLEDLLDKAKQSKSSLKELKELALKLKMYEFATKIKVLEDELFPQTEEQKAEQEKALNLQRLFTMIELNVPLSACWRIGEAIDKYKELGGDFSLMDSAKIIAKSNEIFHDN